MDQLISTLAISGIGFVIVHNLIRLLSIPAF